MVVVRKDGLCMQALWSKYKVRRGWLRRKPIKNASQIWQAIERARKVITKGACFLVGDGKSIDVWQDTWIPWLEGYKPSPKDATIPMQHLMVSNFNNQHNKQWNVAALEDYFDNNSVEATKRIIIPLSPIEDKLSRVKDNKEMFSVKPAYRLCQEQRIMINNGVNYVDLWKLKMHERLKMIVWRIGNNVIPTKQNIVDRLGSGDPSCPLGHEESETSAHLFFHCQIAKAIWFGCY